MKLFIETLNITHSKDFGKGYVRFYGTADIEFKGERFTVVVTKHQFDGQLRDEVYAEGFHGRYRTGNKAWPASVSFTKDGELDRVRFGRDDNSSKFQKLNCIYYVKPE